MKSSDNRRVTEVFRWLLILFALAMAAPSLRAQTDTDFDEYKVRIDGFWFYSNPTGTLQDATSGNIISLHKDLAFSSYSTFAGKLDWKFTRKNHLYLVGAPLDQSRQTVLQRTIMFHGQTFNVGVVTKANLSAPLIAPGYQYDIGEEVVTGADSGGGTAGAFLPHELTACVRGRQPIRHVPLRLRQFRFDVG